MPESVLAEPDSWDVERNGEGAVLVRVHSRDASGRPLPDAVFTFRPGDPQYDRWEKEFHIQSKRGM